MPQGTSATTEGGPQTSSGRQRNIDVSLSKMGALRGHSKAPQQAPSTCVACAGSACARWMAAGGVALTNAQLGRSGQGIA
eukprot:3014628-Pyramimonas_sp.AAC.1